MRIVDSSSTPAVAGGAHERRTHRRWWLVKPIELLPPDMRYCDLLSTESIPDCAAALICALKARLPAQDPVLQGVTSEILAAIASQRDKGLAT